MHLFSFSRCKSMWLHTIQDNLGVELVPTQIPKQMEPPVIGGDNPLLLLRTYHFISNHSEHLLWFASRLFIMWIKAPIKIAALNKLRSKNNFSPLEYKRTWLTCPESWPKPHLRPSGWTGVQVRPYQPMFELMLFWLNGIKSLQLLWKALPGR